MPYNSNTGLQRHVNMRHCKTKRHTQHTCVTSQSSSTHQVRSVQRQCSRSCSDQGRVPCALCSTRVCVRADSPTAADSIRWPLRLRTPTNSTYDDTHVMHVRRASHSNKQTHWRSHRRAAALGPRHQVRLDARRFRCCAHCFHFLGNLFPHTWHTEKHCWSCTVCLFFFFPRTIYDKNIKYKTIKQHTLSMYHPMCLSMHLDERNAPISNARNGNN